MMTSVGAALACAFLGGSTQASEIITLRLFNADDIVSAYIDNSAFTNQLILEAGDGGDTGYVDVTSFMRPGANYFTFTALNLGGVWSYGYDIRANGVSFDSGVCGTFGVSGCRDGDTTVGLVFSEDPGRQDDGGPIGGDVPEPSAWALLILGFVALGVRLRRRGLRAA